MSVRVEAIDVWLWRRRRRGNAQRENKVRVSQEVVFFDFCLPFSVIHTSFEEPHLFRNERKIWPTHRFTLPWPSYMLLGGLYRRAKHLTYCSPTNLAGSLK